MECFQDRDACWLGGKTRGDANIDMGALSTFAATTAPPPLTRAVAMAVAAAAAAVAEYLILGIWTYASVWAGLHRVCLMHTLGYVLVTIDSIFMTFWIVELIIVKIQCDARSWCLVDAKLMAKEHVHLPVRKASRLQTC